MARIIDSVLVDDDRPDKSTELNQCVPVATVARQSRRLDCEHSADATLTNRGQQAFEPGPADAIARATEVIVDDLYRGPTELPRPVSEPVLPSPAFVIVHKLIGSRLTNVHVRATGKMLSGDLGHRRALRLRALPRSRAAALRPRLPAPPSVWSPAQQGVRPRRTDFVGEVGIVASSLSFSVSESDWRNRRSASTSVRRDRKISMENRGSLRTL